MNKAHIIGEIQRTAKGNGNVPLGWRRFEKETDIRYYDWFGQFWTRWSDAVREAGFASNSMSEAYDDSFLVAKLVELTRKLGRVPTRGDFLLAGKDDKTIPSEKSFRRFGTKPELALRVVEFCSGPENQDVAALWTPIIAPEMEAPNAREADSVAPRVGYVYLLKHGTRKEYKIGKTFNALRREGEIRLQLPEALTPIHYIVTDDPSGVEHYWHSRFADRRKEGEWFALNADDVRTFKRWKRIY